MIRKKSVFHTVVLIGLVVALSGCPGFFAAIGFDDSADSTEPDEPGQKYTVTYDANEATAGSVPEDGAEYADRDEVTVIGNTGGLLRSGYLFVGWNTTADGTGTQYAAGDTLTIENDVVLYAEWTAESTPPVTYSVTYDANEATAGSVPEDGAEYADGDEVTVMDNTGGLLRSGYLFAGWNTTADGTGTRHAAGDTLTIENDVVLYAEWENNEPSVSIDSPSDGAQVSKNAIVTFRATVSDAEDSTDQLDVVWQMPGGTLGTGTPLSLNALSDIGIGVHSITVTVTDSVGLEAQASITMEVLESVEYGVNIQF